MCCTSRRAVLSAPFRSFNRWFATVLAAVSLAASAPFALAQEVATGVVRGRVQNATNGAALENVNIQVSGTNQTVKTNGYGEYVLRGVPAGEVVLRATYVGEPEQTATVSVTAGVEVSRDFTFRESANTKRLEDGTIMLDPFTVSAERFANARAIAIAEERNSVNIKNVVAIDQFGDVPSGNVGEFVKFLPGIQVEYGAGGTGNNQGFSESTANGVSVRGFGPEDTTIMIDGLPVASAVPGSLTNQTGLDQLSINNASRIELIKVATPDMPANSAGGQINLITRSAFEFSKPSYDVQLFMNINSLNADLKKTPGPVNKDTFKTSPGVTFSVSYPFSKTFGISVSGTVQQEFSQTYRAQPVWNNTWASNLTPGNFTNSAGQVSSFSNPFQSRYQITDSPRFTTSKSGNLKLDWKPTPNQTLKLNLQYSTSESVEAQRKLDFRPVVAAGADWDQYRTIGTTGNGTTAMSIESRDRIGDTFSAALQYALDWKGWRVDVAASSSHSTNDFEDETNGHYSRLELNLNPSRVSLHYGADGLPYNVENFWRAGGSNTTSTPKDHTQLANWSVNESRAFSGQAHNEKTIDLAKIDISRPLDFLPFLRSNPLMLKFGYRRDEVTNLKSGRGTNYRQVLKPGANFTVSDILDTDYAGQSPGFGLPAQQWASTYKLYELNQANSIFEEPLDGDQAIQNYNSYVGQQKDITETKNGYYAMLSGSFFNNRLSFVAGARQEDKSRTGRGPATDSKWNFVKNPDGTVYTDPVLYRTGVTTNNPASVLFATTPAGIALRNTLTAAGITFPTTPLGPVATTLSSRMLQLKANQEINQSSKGDPSFTYGAGYKLTKKIDLKASYSRSFKLQPLESGNVGILSGNNQLLIEPFDLDQQLANNDAKGRIAIANPGLKPETSENIDLEISYYTDNGGKISLSYYTKNVKNATQTFTTYSGTEEFDQAVSALGFEPAEFEDWRVETSANSTLVQKTSGYELFVSQDFGIFGPWGRRISAFASFAITDLPDPAPVAPYTITNPNGTTTTLTPGVSVMTKKADRFGGLGLQYSGNRFLVQIRGTYRNENQVPGTGVTVFADGTELRRMQPAETRIDINASYLINKTYSVFVSARDVFNGHRDEVWEDSRGLIPSFARIHDRKEFGTTWSVGVKGKW
jgi:iron complex outermembrane receptor protein